MTRTRAILIVSTALLAIGLLVLILVAPSIQRSFFYPKPHGLPPVISDSTEQLLARLGSILETNAPAIAQTLQPGLSDDQISVLEAEGGFRLSEDLRALYRWRNSLVTNSTLGIVPGHAFRPLDELVRERQMIHQQMGAATVAQRAAFSVFAGHREGWVHVFDDGAGDGYFFDPERSDAEGAFFFHFEGGYFVWFPSFRNFLAGVIECYETGAFKVSADGVSFDEDFEESQKVWKRYATASEE